MPTTTDPYPAPQTRNETARRRPTSDLRWVRAVLYFHLAAIVVCGFFASADIGLLPVPASIQDVLRYIGPLFALTFIVCPIAMGLAAFQLDRRSINFRVAAVVCDALLSLVQLWVLLPTVQ